MRIPALSRTYCAPRSPALNTSPYTTTALYASPIRITGAPLRRVDLYYRFHGPGHSIRADWTRAMADQANNAETAAHFRRTLVRVMSVQLVSLALLALLQLRYGS